MLPFPLTRFWRQLRRCQQGARLHGTQAMALGITAVQAALRARRAAGPPWGQGAGAARVPRKPAAGCARAKGRPRGEGTCSGKRGVKAEGAAASGRGCGQARQAAPTETTSRPGPRRCPGNARPRVVRGHQDAGRRGPPPPRHSETPRVPGPRGEGARFLEARPHPPRDAVAPARPEGLRRGAGVWGARAGRRG